MGADLPRLSGRRQTWLILGALVSVFIYSLTQGLAARQSETCDAVNEVKAQLVSYIDAQLIRSAKALPTIDYYKQHPVELGRALANLSEQREATHLAFAPTSC